LTLHRFYCSCMKSNQSRTFSAISSDASELEALTDMGMADDALSLAKKIIMRPSPAPADVSAALRAIGVHAHKMQTWKNRVIRMADRLSKRTRHAVREDLLIYFAAIDDHERAVTFLSAPGRFSAQAIFLAVKSLVSLRRFEEADALTAPTMRDCSDPFGDAFRCEATATMLGIEGNHLGALVNRINAPIEEAIESEIVQGILESACALAIRHLATRIERIRQIRRECAADILQLAAPGVGDDLLVEAEKRCDQIRRSLGRLIPQKNLFRYMLEPIPGDADGDEKDADTNPRGHR